MKGCELCGRAARMYCESDQASLCWDCDEKVHCANFLVAKHSRSLLCQVCQSPTPWKASGPKLGPTVSICRSCFSRHNKNQEESSAEEEVEDSHGGDEFHEECDDEDEDEDDDDHGTDDGYDGEDDEGDGENQVVPWSGSASLPLPPVASSSTSEDDISCRFRGGVLKRMRDSSADLDSDGEVGKMMQDDIVCSSSYLGSGRLSNEEGNSWTLFRPLKRTRTGSEVEEDHDGQAKSRSTAIIDSLKTLQTDMISNGDNASATILGISRLSRDQSR